MKIRFFALLFVLFLKKEASCRKKKNFFAKQKRKERKPETNEPEKGFNHGIQKVHCWTNKKRTTTKKKFLLIQYEKSISWKYLLRFCFCVSSSHKIWINFL